MEKTSRARTAKNLLDAFDRLHREYLDDAPAFFRRGKDAALLTQLAASQGEDVTIDLMADYFASADPFIRANGYGVGVFVSQASKLIARRARVGRRAVDWRAECREIHGGRCTNPHFHFAWKAAKP